MLEGIELTRKFRAYLTSWANKIEDTKHKEKMLESLTCAKSNIQLEKLGIEIKHMIEKQTNNMKKTKILFEVDIKLKNEYMDVCNKNGSNMSEEIRKHMAKKVKKAKENAR